MRLISFCGSSYLILVGLHILVGAVEIAYNTPQLIPDGLLVTGGHLIRNHVTTLVVQVVVESPQSNDDLRQHIHRLHDFIISAVLPQGRVSNMTKGSWLQRVRVMEDQVIQLDMENIRTTNTTRAKRGLFDFGGIVLHKVFGLATTAELMESRRWIEQVRMNNIRVLHKTNELVSVVNHTFSEIRLNRKHIQGMQMYIADMYNHITTWQTLSEVAYERLHANIRIDECLSALESTQLLWLRQMDFFKRQRIALKSGVLSETILPLSELKFILQNSHEKGWSSPKAEWFYQYVRIDSIWHDDGHLVYRTSLPLTDHIQFIRYHFTSWPFVPESNGVSLELEIPADIAYDTIGGTMYVPYECLGTNPEICKTGPIYGKSGLTCPRGILTNKYALRKTCRITIRRLPSFTNIIHELHTNTFVILSQGETINIFCPGVPSKTDQLHSGVSLIHLRPGCRIAGDKWILNGIMTHTINIALRFSPVEVVPLNLSEMISSRLLTHHLRSPKWSALPVIKHVQISQLHDPAEDMELVDWSMSTNIPWWQILVLIIIILSGCGMGYYVYRQNGCRANIRIFFDGTGRRHEFVVNETIADFRSDLRTDL